VSGVGHRLKRNERTRGKKAARTAIERGNEGNEDGSGTMLMGGYLLEKKLQSERLKKRGELVFGKARDFLRNEEKKSLGPEARGNS